MSTEDKTTAPDQQPAVGGRGLSEGLGPAVPNNVLAGLLGYGDSRADDDGRSGQRLLEAIWALRRWAAELQAAERERCAELAEDMAQNYTERGARACEDIARMIRRA